MFPSEKEEKKPVRNAFQKQFYAFQQVLSSEYKARFVSLTKTAFLGDLHGVTWISGRGLMTLQ